MSDAEIIDADAGEVSRDISTLRNQGATIAPVDIENLLHYAISTNAGVETLEKLMGLYERRDALNAKRAYNAAIAEARSKIRPIVKTNTVDYTTRNGDRVNYTHETLDGVASQIDPILSQHGLSYRFRSEQRDGRIYVTCIVSHRDGYSEETTLDGANDTSGSKNGYQALGSALTYLQRYSLKLALGLSAAKDDDSIATDHNARITSAQLRDMQVLMEEAEVPAETIQETYDVRSLKDISPNLYPEIMDRLRDRKNRLAQAEIDRKKGEKSQAGITQDGEGRSQRRADPAQLSVLRGEIMRSNLSEEDVCMAYNVATLADLTPDESANACHRLRADREATERARPEKAQDQPDVGDMPPPSEDDYSNIPY